MSDPIYGDRRCPTCQSIKAAALDECWYCNRNKPLSPDEKTAVAAIAKEVGADLKDVLDANGFWKTPYPQPVGLLDPLLIPKGPFVPGKVETTFELTIADAPPMKVVSDPSLPSGTAEIRGANGQTVRTSLADVAEDVAKGRQRFPTTMYNDPSMPSVVALKNLRATQKLYKGPVPTSSLDQIESVMHRVRAMGGHDPHDDAVQLARWLQEALKEIAELRAEVRDLTAKLPPG